MSIQSHLESAEESIRQALVEALADKKDGTLSGLFDLLNTVKELKSSNIDYDFTKDLIFNSDYLNDTASIGDIKIDTGGADIISFPTPEGSVDLGNVDINL
tara:strand:+ start:721 stop:1023 length:303 start_codon:yes stop_codon:yes gene_type:complete